MGMKQIFVMMATVVLVGCSNDERKAEPLPAPDPVPQVKEKIITFADAIVEKKVRKAVNKPEGELTERDAGAVEDLHLEGTQITDEGLKDVVKLRGLGFLDLDNTQITDAGLKEVAKLQNLWHLTIKNTQITDAGLLELANMQQLTYLGLNSAKITDAGVAKIQKALPNCVIGRLSTAPNPPRETP